MSVRRIDRYNTRARLEKLTDMAIAFLESPEGHITFKERISALVDLWRIQHVQMGLRKEKPDEPAIGSAVRKYEGVFQAHDARRRKTAAGSAAAEPADILDFGDDDDDTAA